MRIDVLIGMLQEYIFLALLGIILLALLIGLGYFIYKKIFHGKKSIVIRNIVMLFLFIGYLIVVLSVTFFGRHSSHSQINLHFFSSYRTAWNSFDVKNWQFLIFNIIMFVPLGILLPLAHKRFYKATYTFLTGFALTCLIEIVQLITSRGVFELDDIFNNFLGTIIGYSMVMPFIILLKKQRNKWERAFAYFSPFIITVILFGGMFTYYNLKEFGNLSQNYDYRINMKKVELSSKIDFEIEEKTAIIYKAPTLNKDSSLKFAIDFFENINVDTSDIEIMDYHEEIIYWSRGGKENRSHNINVYNLDGSYRYFDYSAFNHNVELKNISREIIEEKLKTYGIDIPKEAEFISFEEGNYGFTVNKIISGDKMVNGSLHCYYFSDDTIKSIINNLVVYEKISDVPIISEKEAYEEVKKGKFHYPIYGPKINIIEIKGIYLDYKLDSKGYLQPVYSLESNINNKPYSILIPALK